MHFREAAVQRKLHMAGAQTIPEALNLSTAALGGSERDTSKKQKQKQRNK